jgi:N-acyl-D-amino-acid deacylase
MSNDAPMVLDVATHEDPEQASARLWHVIANGVFAVRDGQYTGARAGKLLRAR